MEVRLDPAKVAALAMDAKVQEVLTNKLERAKAVAYNNCPIDTGLLRSTIRVEKSEDGTGEQRLTYGSQEAHYAPYIEFGTRHMQAYHVLGNAKDALKS